MAHVSHLAEFSRAGKQEYYQKLLKDIQSKVLQLQERFEEVFQDVLRQLRKKKIYFVNEKQLDQSQKYYVEDYFHRFVLPELKPVLLDEARPLPEMADGRLYLAVHLESEGKSRFALIEVPRRLDRFLSIPQKKGKAGAVFIVLDNVIRHCLTSVFRGAFPIDSAAAYAIKVSRNSELELDEGVSKTLLDKISASLKKRKSADPVRVVFDQEMPDNLMQFLTRRLNLGRYDSVIAGGRYHNAKDFISFPRIRAHQLEQKELALVPHPSLEPSDASIFEAIRHEDQLLCYPYHSFGYIIDLVQTAAIDPAVKSIKIVLYRVADHSRIANALLNAVRNGKSVTAMVELQARFDEAANIDWARRLTEGGVNVIPGIPGLKVHSKLILISRQEGSSLRYYSHVGTGNFNEKTAKVYTDFSLLTYNQEIGQEVAQVFEFLRFNYLNHKYRHLLVSPFSNRKHLEELVMAEIAAAKLGKPARIDIKCNNFVDASMIERFYEASQAGVKIRIIVRGTCGLLPGVKGLSTNIEAISVVDRFLEHPRLYIFHNGGQEKMYLSSADLMARNLDQRVEVSCPIYDPKIRTSLRDIFDIQWCDNQKARIIDQYRENNLSSGCQSAKLRSQEAIHQYLLDGKLPTAVIRARKKKWPALRAVSWGVRAPAAKNKSGAK